MTTVSNNKRKMLILLCFAICMFSFYELIIPIFENKSPGIVSKKYQHFPEDIFDVVFIGSSVTLNGIYPLQLYHENGISAYNLASAGQSLPASYYIVKEVLREQHPKLIVLDVYTCFAKSIMGGDGQTHYVSNSLKLPEKWEFIIDVVPKEKRSDFIFELGTYHTRWEELTKMDFTKAHPNKKDTYGAQIW